MPNNLTECANSGRDYLVERLSELAKSDDRIRAAWLFGSLGRGTADVLSDIDVFFVVADEHLAEIAAQRRNYACKISKAHLFVEAPQNAPKDGAYLMAWYYLYRNPLCCVDWYFQPKSLAVIPSETLVLCDKDELPRKSTPTQFDGYQPIPENSPLEAAQNTFALAWAMLWIAGKYAVRSPYEEKLELLRYSLNAYNEVCRFLGKEETPITDEILTASIPKIKIQVLDNHLNRLNRVEFDLGKFANTSSARRFVETKVFIQGKLFSLMPNAPHLE